MKKITDHVSICFVDVITRHTISFNKFALLRIFNSFWLIHHFKDKTKVLIKYADNVEEDWCIIYRVLSISGNLYSMQSTFQNPLDSINKYEICKLQVKSYLFIEL